MSLLMDYKTELGETLKERLNRIFNEYNVKRAYLFEYNGNNCIIAKIRNKDLMKDLEKDMENELGYYIKVYDLDLFDIGKMNWKEPGISKEIEDRLEFLYKITKTMELIFKEDRLKTQALRRGLDWNY